MKQKINIKNIGNHQTYDGYIKILALGSSSSSAFKSIYGTIKYFGEISFKSENDFRSSILAVNEILSGPYDVVILPNPYGNERRLAIYRRLRAIGFPVIVFDRGGLPNSWFFDSGFNADSPSYSRDVWDRPLSEEETAVTTSRIREFKDVLPPLEEQGARIGGEALKRHLGLQGKKILFVPFQRPSDTTIRYFADPIGSFEAFCNLVDSVDASLGETDPDWVIVAKRHPLETERPSTAVRFVEDDCHVYDLIEMADALLLVNSGVGLMASLWAKPVMVAGTAFYRDDRLNRSVQTKEDILRYLRDLPRVDLETRNRFIHHLTTNVYSFGTFHTELVQQNDGSFRNITRRIDFSSVCRPQVKRSKRLLYISSVIPRPINRGSALRTDQILRALEQSGYRVEILLLNQSERGASSQDLIERLAEYYPRTGISVRRHPNFLTWRKVGQIGRLFRYRVHRLWESVRSTDGALNSIRHCPKILSDTLKRKLKSQDYDVLVFNYLKLIPNDVDFGDAKVIVDLHDVQADRIENDVLPKISNVRRQRFLRHAIDSERKLIERSDIAICISDMDEIRIANRYHPSTPLVTIPATCESRLPKESRFSRNGLFDLLFVGSNSDPNVDGLSWFLTECWPTILEQNPEATLLVQGRIIRNREIAKLLNQQTTGNLFTSEFVEDLSRIYRRARIAVCPIRYGTGMKIKVVEAMAHGKAIVATNAAMEGIRLDSRLCPADEPELFAQECLHLLEDPAALARAEEASRICFERDHSQEGVIPKIQELLRNV